MISVSIIALVVISGMIASTFGAAKQAAKTNAEKYEKILTFFGGVWTVLIVVISILVLSL